MRENKIFARAEDQHNFTEKTHSVNEISILATEEKPGTWDCIDKTIFVIIINSFL
jgi:hypothetical protein